MSGLGHRSIAPCSLGRPACCWLRWSGNRGADANRAAPVPPANPTGGWATVVSVAVSCALNVTLPAMETLEPDGTDASLVLDTMFRARAPASPALVAHVPAVADAVVLARLARGRTPGVTVCTSIVGRQGGRAGRALDRGRVARDRVADRDGDTDADNCITRGRVAVGGCRRVVVGGCVDVDRALPAVTVDESTYA